MTHPDPNDPPTCAGGCDGTATLDGYCEGGCADDPPTPTTPPPLATHGDHVRYGHPLHLTADDLPARLDDLTDAGVTGHEVDVVTGRLVGVALTPGEVVNLPDGTARVLSWSLALELEVAHPLPDHLLELLAEPTEVDS